MTKARFLRSGVNRKSHAPFCSGGPGRETPAYHNLSGRRRSMSSRPARRDASAVSVSLNGKAELPRDFALPASPEDHSQKRNRPRFRHAIARSAPADASAPLGLQNLPPGPALGTRCSPTCPRTSTGKPAYQFILECIPKTVEPSPVATG